MSKLIVTAKAPSNIALIKYMGKKDASANLPENPSISMTLNGLCTYAEIARTENGSGHIAWDSSALKTVHDANAAFHDPRAKVPALDEKAVERITRHVDRVRNAAVEILPHFGVAVVENPQKKLDLTLRSANTFPASSGIASSASSFAAVTLGVAAACARDPQAFRKAWDSDVKLKRALARVSRQGSGSSCRSFEGPWVYWEGENAVMLETGMPRMAHFVIVISSAPKKVSSSQAHAQAKTSPLWEKRTARVEKRLEEIKAGLSKANFREVSRIAWAETWEMHSLFHTAAEPFTYWETETLDVLHDLAPLIRDEVPAPIITMDAGPNVHVLVDYRLRDEWRKKLRDLFGPMLILEDEQGNGAEVNVVQV